MKTLNRVPSKTVLYALSGVDAGGIETSPLLNKNEEPQHWSVAVLLFGSAEIIAQASEGWKVQCLSKAFIFSFDSLYKIMPLEPPDTSTEPPIVCNSKYAGSFMFIVNSTWVKGILLFSSFLQEENNKTVKKKPTY